MGACKFCETIEGEDAGIVFDDWASDLREEYGDDAYNGTASTCELVGKPVKIADKYSKASEKRGQKYVEDHDYGSKWEARCLDLGVTKYVLREVRRAATHKDRPEYVWKYVVIRPDGSGKFFSCKGEADAHAKNLIMETGVDSIHVERRHVLVKGTETVTDFKVTEKTYASRPHPKNMEGKRIVEIHKFMFYGWAAE